MLKHHHFFRLMAGYVASMYSVSLHRLLAMPAMLQRQTMARREDAV